MTMFLTKVWGFSVPCGPLQFSLAGWRDRARDMLSNGDLVVLVGTKEAPTDSAERGRVLGIMKPTKEPVMSLDFQLETFSHDFNDEGEYKWPYALINNRAWLLLDRPLLDEVTSRSFNMDAAAGIVPLHDAETNHILTLRREEIEVLKPIGVQARLEGYEVARRRNTPPPTTKRTGIMHVRHAPAYTYAMEVRGAAITAFKIGWAFNYNVRAHNSIFIPCQV
jgi:hypothetical protein